MDKLHINDFIAKVSNEELMKAVDDQLHWQKTGKRKFERTVRDELVEIYFAPLIGHDGAHTQFEAYNFITNEIAKRLYHETFTVGNPFVDYLG